MPDRLRTCWRDHHSGGEPRIWCLTGIYHDTVIRHQGRASEPPPLHLSPLSLTPSTLSSTLLPSPPLSLQRTHTARHRKRARLCVSFRPSVPASSCERYAGGCDGTRLSSHFSSTSKGTAVTRTFLQSSSSPCVSSSTPPRPWHPLVQSLGCSRV